MRTLTMTREEMDGFLKEAWPTTVATLTKSGHPHVTPIWCYYDGKHFYLTLMDGGPKSRSLARDNRIALSFVDERPPKRSVLVHGIAELIRGDVRDIVHRIVEKHIGADLADAKTDMMMENPQVIVKITPTRIYTWDMAKGTFAEKAAAEISGKEFRTF